VALIGALLLVFVLFIRPQEFIPALQSLSLLNVATGLGVLGIAIEVATGRLKSLASPQLPLLAAFLGWCVICTAIKAGTSAVVDMKTTVLFSTIFMVVVMYAGRSFERFRALAMMLLAISIALAVICSHQAQGEFQCILLDKEENGQAAHDQSKGHSDGRTCESYHDCDKDKSSDDEFACEKPGLFDTFTVAHGRVRWRGTFADPNELSVAIGAAMAFAFAMHASSKRKIRHLLLAAVIPIATYCVVLTGSRGGVLVLLAVFGTYFVRRYGAKGIAAGLMAGAPLLMIGGRTGEDAEASSLERIGALYEGVDFFKSSPIFGLGQGQFVEHYFITAHNSYLLSAAELGFPGMLLWTLLVYVSVKIPFVLASRPPADVDPRLVPYAFALVVAFAGILVGIFFLSFCYHNMLFIYFGLAGALYGAAKATSRSFQVKVSLKEVGAIAALDVAFLVILFVYTRIKGQA
jgi:O-antigen ligase